MKEYIPQEDSRNVEVREVLDSRKIEQADYRRIELQDHKWVSVKETGLGEFEVIDSNITTKSSPNLIFKKWAEGVENLDNQSDEWEIWEYSKHLRWENVDLSPTSFRAPSLDRLTQALQKVSLGSYDPDDI